MGTNYLKKELYERIKVDEAIFDFLQNAALDGIWYWDLKNPENEWMSPKFWQTFGLDPDDKKHASSEWQSIIFKSDLEVATENLKKHLDDPSYPYDQIVRYKHKNGSTVWIRCRGMAIRDHKGKPIRLLGAHMDITELMKSQDELKRLKNEYETVFDGSQDALFLVGVRGPKDFCFIRNNKTHQQRTGISLAMIQGVTPQELLDPVSAQEVIGHYQECVDKQSVITYQETLNLPSGKKIWHTTLTPIVDDAKVLYIVGSAVDITAQKELEKELEYRANYDALTGLANRDYLTRKVAEYAKDKNRSFTFMFIDLDGFKTINDRYGHAIGDRLLKVIAKRFLSITSDDGFVSRLGGDEFVILKNNYEDHSKIKKFMDEIITTVQEPCVIESHKISVGVSVGYARFPIDGVEYDELSRYADKKMYERKNTAKNY